MTNPDREDEIARNRFRADHIANATLPLIRETDESPEAAAAAVDEAYNRKKGNSA